MKGFSGSTADAHEILEAMPFSFQAPHGRLSG